MDDSPRWEVRERKPLPTKEQIDAIPDAVSVEVLIQEVERVATKIETDLEFRSEGDLAWEGRARGALTAHRICLTNLRRRLHRLAGKPAANLEAEAQIRVAKGQKHAINLAQTQAANRKRELENERLHILNQEKRDRAREKTQQRALGLIEATSLYGTFFAEARRRLDPILFGEILATAAEHQMSDVAQAAVQVIKGD